MFKARLAAWVSALFFLSLTKQVAPFPTPAESDRSDLRGLLTHPSRAWSPNTTVSFPGSPNFANATQRWSIFSPPTYSAAINPGTEEDISKVVRKHPQCSHVHFCQWSNFTEVS